jgi:hypothetical protein
MQSLHDTYFADKRHDIVCYYVTQVSPIIMRIEQIILYLRYSLSKGYQQPYVSLQISFALLFGKCMVMASSSDFLSMYFADQILVHRFLLLLPKHLYYLN